MKVDKHILLFDGVCNLCNGIVQFVIKRDKSGKFMFASLQSDKGQELLKKHDFPTQNFETFIYIHNDKAYKKSSAALRVLRQLGGLWQLLYIFVILPVPVRDLLYGLVANNRYKLFGKKDTCMLPTPELKARFL